MRVKKDPFLDKNFLKELDQQKEKVIYAKIISLDFEENYLEEIEGHVTGGNISVNGSSNLRRTCSINLIAPELNIHDFYWGLNTKFKLFIGVENRTDPDYPDIIWFKQGIYIITSFSTTQNISSYTVSIQGQDKMCLINGGVGGAIYSLTADFGKLETVDSQGVSTITDIPLKEIITEGVHAYAREPYQNIIITDLDEVGLELLEYRGDTPLYFLENVQSGEVSNIFLEENTRQYWLGKKQDGKYIKLNTKINLDDPKFIYNSRTDYLKNAKEPTYVVDENGIFYTVFKVTYGEVVGFRETDLTYPGDLIGQVGNSFAQGCLEPIKNMLGDFEYFYDIDGRFHFQRKRTFVNVSFNNIISNEDSEQYIAPNALTSAVTYSFENANLISSFQNKPDLAKLKNDFSIWGNKSTTKGSTYPIHLRYAIDKKPVYYKNYDGEVYTTGYKSYELLLEEFEKNEQDIDVIGSQQNILPDGLNYEGSLWWNMETWGELYYKLAGEYPDGGVGNYSQGFTKVDLQKYFPNGISWDANRDLHIFDVKNTEDGNLNGPLYSTVHNPYCSHRYWTYFVENARSQGFTSYIWNPVFPSEDMQEQYQEQIAHEKEARWKYFLQYHNYNCDWREIIYQMAKDYMRHGHDKDFLATVAKNNPNWYPTGQTGYEIYYTDIFSFWRELYNPHYDYTYDVAYVTAGMIDNDIEKKYYYFRQCDNNTLYDATVKYYSCTTFGVYEPKNVTSKDLQQFENNATLFVFKDPSKVYYVDQGGAFDPNRTYYTRHEGDYDKERYVVLADSQNTTISEPNPNFGWNTSITESPQNLTFWFDFLDSVDGSLSLYNVRNVGNRPKAVNDKDVKAIYYRDTPTVIFIDADDWDAEIDKQKAAKPGYAFVRFPNYMDPLFSLSTQKKSAKEALDDFLYQYTYCTESITIQSVPVYYLEPNTRIFVRDDNSGINGEYIIDKISYQLTYNGMMTINAVKAVDRIY